jgi:GT2 family glycosyltransferase
MKLGIAIINWNSGSHLASAVESVDSEAQKISGLDWRGLVWDNNSTDGSNSLAHEYLHNWQLIHAKINHGFAQGNNNAVGYLQGYDWIFLLNPDAKLEANALSHLIEACSQNTEYSAIGPSLVAWPKTSHLDGMGDRFHASGFAWRDAFGLSTSFIHKDMKPYETFAVSGAALLIRRDLFEALGGFDEDFFCYQEDVDLGFRLRLMGHRALQVPSAVVYHVGSQSTGGHRSDFSVYHGRRNLVWCYVKNMPGILFWLFLPYHLALNMVELIYFTYQGQGRVIWRAKWDAIKGLPKMWRKRQQIQVKRVATLGDIWRALDKRLWPWGFKSIRAKSGRRFGKD